MAAAAADWIAWTLPTQILFAILAVGFVILAILDMKHKSIPRKGFLPIPTTRGDRVFIGLMALIIISFIWLALDLPLYYVLIPGLLVYAIILIWG